MKSIKSFFHGCITALCFGLLSTNVQGVRHTELVQISAKVTKVDSTEFSYRRDATLSFGIQELALPIPVPFFMYVCAPDAYDALVREASRGKINTTQTACVLQVTVHENGETHVLGTNAVSYIGAIDPSHNHVASFSAKIIQEGVYVVFVWSSLELNLDAKVDISAKNPGLNQHLSAGIEAVPIMYCNLLCFYILMGVYYVIKWKRMYGWSWLFRRQKSYTINRYILYAILGKSLHMMAQMIRWISYSFEGYFSEEHAGWALLAEFFSIWALWTMVVMVTTGYGFTHVDHQWYHQKHVNLTVLIYMAIRVTDSVVSNYFQLLAQLIYLDKARSMLFRATGQTATFQKTSNFIRVNTKASERQERSFEADVRMLVMEGTLSDQQAAEVIASMMAADAGTYKTDCLQLVSKLPAAKRAEVYEAFDTLRQAAMTHTNCRLTFFRNIEKKMWVFILWICMEMVGYISLFRNDGVPSLALEMPLVLSTNTSVLYANTDLTISIVWLLLTLSRDAWLVSKLCHMLPIKDYSENVGEIENALATATNLLISVRKQNTDSVAFCVVQPDTITSGADEIVNPDTIKLGIVETPIPGDMDEKPIQSNLVPWKSADIDSNERPANPQLPTHISMGPSLGIALSDYLSQDFDIAANMFNQTTPGATQDVVSRELNFIHLQRQGSPSDPHGVPVHDEVRRRVNEVRRAADEEHNIVESSKDGLMQGQASQPVILSDTFTAALSHYSLDEP